MSPIKVFWKHRGKRRIARNKQFLLFPQCFLSVWQTFRLFCQIWNCRLQTLSVLKSPKFVLWERVKMFTSYLVGCYQTSGGTIQEEHITLKFIFHSYASFLFLKKLTVKVTFWCKQGNSGYFHYSQRLLWLFKDEYHRKTANCRDNLDSLGARPKERQSKDVSDLSGDTGKHMESKSREQGDIGKSSKIIMM